MYPPILGIKKIFRTRRKPDMIFGRKQFEDHHHSTSSLSLHIPDLLLGRLNEFWLSI